MAINLTDDGTMDTVLRCSDCDEEFRFNYDRSPDAEEYEANALAALRDANPTLTDARLRELLDETLYSEWIDGCIAETEAEHECPTDEDLGPQDGDLVTSDHRTFNVCGGNRLAFELTETIDGAYRAYSGKYPRLGEYATVESAVRAYMDLDQYWPNCWFVSDHGNAHLMDLNEG